MLNMWNNVLKTGMPSLDDSPVAHASSFLDRLAGEKGEKLLVLIFGADVNELLFE